MVPMVVPAIGVLGLFTFIAYWNSFLWPLIVINSRDLATVPLGLQFFLSQQGYQWNLLMAGGTISLVPGLLLAFVLAALPFSRYSRCRAWAGVEGWRRRLPPQTPQGCGRNELKA